MTVTVRRMHDSDLASVVAAMGQHHYFADRLARQAAGHGVVLLALDRGHVVGDVYVWLSPADEPELRRHLPGVPLLNHLEVLPARQSRGIGTRIIAAAERTVYDLAYRRLALGVGIDNPRARKLYERLGYVDWGNGTVDTSYDVHRDDGRVDTFHETIAVLVKNL
jgi:GNAT superfamily N-acetyltransferase